MQCWQPITTAANHHGDSGSESGMHMHMYMHMHMCMHMHMYMYMCMWPSEQTDNADL